MLRSAEGPILNSVVTASSTAEVTFEQTPEGSEGESHGPSVARELSGGRAC